MPEPTPHELWRQAGGETDAFDRDRYRALLIQYGHLVPLAPGEQAQPLPCGWPAKRYPDDEQYLETAHLTAEERRDALGPRPGPWLACPNTPPCPHPGLIHDIEDYDDPSPTCCVDGCRCGAPEPIAEGASDR